jgi:hypothetical protein
VPRRSNTQITSELAHKIVGKLEAVKENAQKGAPHDLYVVYENGAAVALFGIRRGSQKNLGHDHIPKQIHVNAFKAKQLANCPMSRDQWIEELKNKDLLPKDDDAEANENKGSEDQS